MQVTNIQYYQANNYQKPKFQAQKATNPSFGNWSLIVRDPKTGEIVNRTTSEFFRAGDKIKKIADALVGLYSGADRVSTRFYGCSDCSELASFYMYLDSNYGARTVRKFGSPTAVDILQASIDKAKSRRYAINGTEYYNIQQFTQGNIARYFEENELAFDRDLSEFKDNLVTNLILYTEKFNQLRNPAPNEIEIGVYAKLKEEYANKVNYKVADILGDYQNIEPEKSLTFASNFWPYIGDENVLKLVNRLGNRLEKGSSIVIGGFDRAPENYESHIDLAARLKNAGFRNHPNSEYLFVKE